MNEKWTVGLTAVGSSLIAFFSPVFILVYIMIALVLFDFITKVSAIIKKEKGKSLRQKCYKIKSYLAKFTPIKALFYSIFILLVYAIEIGVFGQSVYIANIFALMFYMVELYSIAENLDFCFGSNIFVTAIKKVRKLFENRVANVISDKIDKIEE
ncbi:MAG: hypothetical protein EOL97_15630 [Spirochaetia bacterium]|nr:hypothetical protein [Spirochaetia bacterium]